MQLKAAGAMFIPGPCLTPNPKPEILSDPVCWLMPSFFHPFFFPPFLLRFPCASPFEDATKWNRTQRATTACQQSPRGKLTAHCLSLSDFLPLYLSFPHTLTLSLSLAAFSAQEGTNNLIRSCETFVRCPREQHSDFGRTFRMQPRSIRISCMHFFNDAIESFAFNALEKMPLNSTACLQFFISIW